MLFFILQRDDVRGPLQRVFQSHSGPHSDSPHLFPQTATLQADTFSWENHDQPGLYKPISILLSRINILQRSSQKSKRQIWLTDVIDMGFISALSDRYV